MPAQQLVETRFEYPVHRHGLMIAAGAARRAGQSVERDLALLAAVEVAQCRDAARQLVVAEQDRGARADPVGPPHAALQIAGIAEIDDQPGIAQLFGQRQQRGLRRPRRSAPAQSGAAGRGGSSISIASRSMPAAQPTPGIAGPPINSTSPS